LLSNDAHSANHFRLEQAGVMNINEHKCTSASPWASQPIADGHFVHSCMGFVVKFVAANVSLSFLKTLLYGIIVKYHIRQLAPCKLVQKLH